jgi:hypothetical protein
MTYIQNFVQPPGETSHLLRFVSRRQPQLLLLPHHILSARGRTALHWAAEEGHAAVVEQLISAGATVDAAGWNGRGPGRVFGSFGSGCGEMTEGVRTLAEDFRSLLWDVEWYLLLKDPLL